MQPLFLFYSKLNKYILAFSFEPNYFGTTFFSLSLNPYFALRNLCTVYFWTTAIKKLKFYISLEQTLSFISCEALFFTFTSWWAFLLKFIIRRAIFFSFQAESFLFLFFFLSFNSCGAFFFINYHYLLFFFTSWWALIS